jgi:fused signal recognition particle receptor
MFGKLREKLKSWTKKIKEESAVSEIQEKEIKIPKKFNTGTQKFEPDLEKAPEIQEEIEKIKPGTESFFKKVTSKISKIKITEKEFEIYGEELELLLLENNVAIEVTEKIIQNLKEKIIGKELLKKEVESEIKDCLKEIIEEILIEPFDIIKKISEKKNKQTQEPYVFLFCGINGTGKTTSIAKIARYLQKKNISCVLAAADTFRAASIEQLKKHGEKLGIKVIANAYGSDPASIGFDAIKYAKKNLVDCVLIDTAGRMHTAKNLLKEIEKISRVCKPDLKIFVGESIAGNDILEQARSFNFSIGIEGIILTKADTDEKGGTALSIGYATKKPILFLGTGQEYKNIEIFDKNKFIKELGL